MICTIRRVADLGNVRLAEMTPFTGLGLEAVPAGGGC